MTYAVTKTTPQHPIVSGFGAETTAAEVIRQSKSANALFAVALDVVGDRDGIRAFSTPWRDALGD